MVQTPPGAHPVDYLQARSRGHLHPSASAVNPTRLPRRAVGASAFLLAAGLAVAVQAQTLPTLPAVRPAMPPVLAVEAVNAWPHDSGAFTQGLVFHEGRL